MMNSLNDMVGVSDVLAWKHEAERLRDRLAAIEREVRIMAAECDAAMDYAMGDRLRALIDTPDAGRDPRSYPATMSAEDDQQPVGDAPDEGGEG